MSEINAKQTFKVATFNLRKDSLFDFGNRWRYRKSHAIGEMKRLGASVIGVQELLPSMREDITEQLDGYSVFGLGRSKSTGGEHNDIFIDNELAEVSYSKTFWLSKNPDKLGSRAYYALFPRICTVCEVLLHHTGRKFRVYNTHLDHICGPAKRLGVRMILENIRVVNEIEPMPVIIMGDLNAKPGDTAVRMLIENRIKKFRNTLAEVGERMGRTYHGFKGKKQGEQIDYIFVSEEFEIENAQIRRDRSASRFPSDHYSVVATLSLSV
ncbi:MAG: endonuclease/exonuclease/phosphatase family protein [Clostridia bacterium]|nr:endonuclease/exonuclease/phosphatase family protein [Clostridia bacterium]